MTPWSAGARLMWLARFCRVYPPWPGSRRWRRSHSRARWITQVLEALKGAMFSASFRGWKGYTLAIQRQRFREGYRTQVEEVRYDNQVMQQQIRDMQQKCKFLTDGGAKAMGVKLVAMLGHRSLTMWFQMWRQFTRDSIFERRDKVQLEWQAKLAETKVQGHLASKHAASRHLHGGET